MPAVRHMPASSQDVGVDVREVEASLDIVEQELAATIDQMMANKYASHNHRQAVLTGTVLPRGGRHQPLALTLGHTANGGRSLQEVDRCD